MQMCYIGFVKIFVKKVKEQGKQGRDELLRGRTEPVSAPLGLGL